MSDVADAAEALRAAVATVEGVRVYTDPGASVGPPGVIVGPPTLQWESVCNGPPDSATFLIIVAVAADDRAMERLWDLVVVVAEAVDGVTDASVKEATPGVWETGGTRLPCYEITTEVSL